VEEMPNVNEPQPKKEKQKRTQRRRDAKNTQRFFLRSAAIAITRRVQPSLTTKITKDTKFFLVRFVAFVV
jgi:hypothetical protein